jgi:murein DD-endopeptidase MepM/ murein hydrolase activator NlpD
MGVAVTPRTLARAALAVVAATGVVAAFATMAPSPALITADSPLVEALSLRTQDGLLLAPMSYRREERFQRGDTLAGFLLRLGIADAHIERLKRVRALQQLRPGMLVAAEVGADGTPLYLTFLNARDVVRIGSAAEGFRSSVEPAEFEPRNAMKAGVVRSSLFAASDAAGIPDSVAMQLADVFGGDIDFHRDLRKGDRFEVVYELYHFAGRPVRAGRVLAAQFTNQGKTFRAVYFKGGYYAQDGQNLRKAFLRSPLEFSRVSSGFGMRRHPLHKSWMAHKGIDYAAPIGTRVRAAGNGFVEFAGEKGGYGNVVILRHSGQYSTVYAHLSRIAVRRGARVEQNDTIGFVGQTGWATGPHLHYEFRIAGEARNPFAIAMPAAAPVAPQDLPEFLARARPLTARLDLLANGELAQLE